jgi:hypothetical protein
VNISGEYAGNFGTILARGAGEVSGGSVALRSTSQTLVTSGAVIDASGGVLGSGGQITLLSDTNTTVAGSLIARGGEAGGDGGFVELSSKGGFAFSGSVDTLAPAGAVGTFLLDPKNITIAAAGTDPISPQFFSTNPGTDATIANTTINATLANVVLQANNDITVNTAVNMGGNGIGITLQAGRSVNVNADVTTNNGAISITANDDAAIVANRDAGLGSITMAAGTTLNSGNRNIDLTVESPGAGTGGGIALATVSASTGALTVSSVGAITDANGASHNITAGDVIFTTTGTGSAVGTLADPLETTLASLTATTHDGGVFIAETDSMILSAVLAKEGGFAPFQNGSNQIVIDTGNPHPGTFDVNVTAGGDIVLGTVAAPDEVTVSSGGMLLDANQGSSNVTARALVIGGAAAMGQAPDPIEVTVEKLTASSATGGVYVAQAIGG